MRHQVAHLQVRQVGRRAAAEMQLLQLVQAGEQLALHFDFTLQVTQVGDRLAAVARDDLVAGAVIANGVAKRYVHVQRQWMAAAVGAQAGHRLQIIAIAEIIAETVGGRIRGIARPGPIETLDEVGIEGDCLDQCVLC